MPQRALQYLIFASPKSGTTWLQRLLSSHPEVHCSETRLFGRHIDPTRPSGLGITLESYVENTQRHFHPPAAASAVPTAPGSFASELLFDLVDQIARTTSRYSGKPIYGEKLTPYLGTASHVLERLKQYSADTRLIFLVRDGRDVAVSGAAQWNNLTRSASAAPPDEFAAPVFAPGIDERYFDMFLTHWTEAAAAYEEHAASFPNRLVVRYEDMLNNPTVQAQRLLRFIGADASADTVEECVRAASFERLSGGRASGEEDASSFFRKGVAGDWRTKLSTEQVFRFEHIAGHWLREHGYDFAVNTYTELKPSNTTTGPSM